MVPRNEEPMRLSKRDAIEHILDGKYICPNCGKDRLISKEIIKEETTEKRIGESFDSYMCMNCGQRFTVSFDIIYSPTVEYTEDVGDKADGDTSKKLIGE
jgi:DNA-directed RNA polymerase subunit RPC12/RpoP